MGQLGRCLDELAKETRPENQLRVLSTLESRCGPRQAPNGTDKIFDFRGRPCGPKAVEEATDGAALCSSMDLSVDSFEVAQGLVDSTILRFEEEEIMRVPDGLERGRESELEWHVETCAGSRHAAEVVDGRSATPDQLDQPIQVAPPGIRDLEHATRLPSQGDQSTDEGDEDRFEFLVERDV